MNMDIGQYDYVVIGSRMLDHVVDYLNDWNWVNNSVHWMET